MVEYLLYGQPRSQGLSSSRPLRDPGNEVVLWRLFVRRIRLSKDTTPTARNLNPETMRPHLETSEFGFLTDTNTVEINVGRENLVKTSGSDVGVKQNVRTLSPANAPGGAGYSINYWVGKCRWDSEALSLY